MAQPLNRIYPVAPTITAGAYSSGQNIGGATRVDLAGIGAANGSGGVLYSLNLSDVDSQSADIDVFFFSAQPTVTDNQTFAPTKAQVKRCLGVVHLATANAIAVGANGKNVMSANIGLMLPASFWVVLVARGAATYASTSSLTLSAGVLSD